MANKNQSSGDLDPGKQVITGSGTPKFLDNFMAKLNNPKFALLFLAVFAIVGVGFGSLAFAARVSTVITKAPQLISPENFSEHESAPTLTWDRFRGAGGYDIEYTVINDTEFLNAQSAHVGRRTSTYTPEITTDGDYIWRVRGTGRYNSLGPWSDVWVYTIVTPENDPNPLPPADPDPEPPTPAAETFYIQAEDYNTGGQNVAYYDTTPGNEGKSYRTDDVDVGGTSDEGGGYRIGWIADGEWTKYDFKVNSSADYYLSMRVARLQYNDRTDTYFRLYVDGQPVGERVTMKATGGWENWTTLGVGNVQLSEGDHTLQFVAVDNQGMQHLLNLNWFSFVPGGGDTATPPPPPEPPMSEPTTFFIQAEDYNTGGQNKGYSDTTSGNTGGEFRNDDVDIAGADDEGGGYRVGWIADTEWLKYDFVVDASSPYALSMRIARLKYNDRVNTYFRAYVDGEQVGNRITITNTGGWQNWITINIGDVQLNAGNHTLEFKAIENGGMEHLLNLNWFSFVPTDSVTTPTDPTPPPPDEPTPPPPEEPTPPPPTGSGSTADCKPGPFVGSCAYSHNTGPRVSKSSLTKSGGMNITKDNTVIEKMEINGTITINANNVTIRDSWIYSGSFWTIRVASGSLNIEYSEIGNYNIAGQRGLGGNNVTAKYLDIHGSEDGIKLGWNSTYDHIWIHDLDSPNPSPHADGMQAEGSLGNAVFKNSTIEALWASNSSKAGSNSTGGANAAIIIKSDFGPQKDTTFENVYLNGGNYIIFIKDGGYGAPQNITFKDCYIGPTMRYGVISKSGPVNSINNVWYANNQPISL